MSTPVNLRTLLEEFPCLWWLARAVRTWKWCIISLWLRIWQSLSLCLGVACGVRLDFPADAWDAMLGSPVDGLVVSGCCLWSKIGFPWSCCGCNSWFDSGYMVCVSFERFLDEFHTFCVLRRTRILQYCLHSHAERRSGAQLMLQFTVFFALLTQRNLDIISTTMVADCGCDEFGHFCCIFEEFLQHFSGSSSELSPRVSAQALAHVQLVLVTCIVVVRV